MDDERRGRDEHPPASPWCEHGHRWASPTPCVLCEDEHDEAMRRLAVALRNAGGRDDQG